MNSKSKRNAAWNTARDMQELLEEKWNLEITKPRKDVKEKKKTKKRRGDCDGLWTCSKKTGMLGKKERQWEKRDARNDSNTKKTNPKRSKNIASGRRERNMQTRSGIENGEASSTKRISGEKGETEG